MSDEPYTDDDDWPGRLRARGHPRRQSQSDVWGSTKIPIRSSVNKSATNSFTYWTFLAEAVASWRNAGLWPAN